MKFGKDGEYYYIEIENKEDLEKLKKDILKKVKEKQKRKIS
jgi:hypothetical protein